MPFWERVQELDVPVYLHPGNVADHPAMFAHRPELDGPIFAWTADTAAHALRLVFGGTLARYPNVKIILGHMGETLPFLLWRLDSRREFDLGEKLAPEVLPSAIIKRNIAITTSGVCDGGALLAAIQALGEDNVMFSVDYPYEDPQVAADFIESAPIGEDVREGLLRQRRTVTPLLGWQAKSDRHNQFMAEAGMGERTQRHGRRSVAFSSPN